MFNAHHFPPVCRVSTVHIQESEILAFSFVLLIAPFSDTGMFTSPIYIYIYTVHVKKLGHLNEFHGFMYQDIIKNYLVLGRS